MGSLRWGRIVLGGILGECILIAAIVPIRLAGGSEDVVTDVAVGGSFVAFVLVAWLLGRSINRPMLNGVLMGAAAAAVYILTGLVARLFVPDAPPTPFIYNMAHALKLAGGATGGWLAQRASARTASHTARIG